MDTQVRIVAEIVLEKAWEKELNEDERRGRTCWTNSKGINKFKKKS